ncbi:MAG: PrsW family intramembrane metalloprotease [bacterium]
MKCYNCGGYVKNEYVFCPNCGSLLGSSEAKIAPPPSSDVLREINSLSSKQTFITRLLIVCVLFSFIFLISGMCFSLLMLRGYSSGGFLGLVLGLLAAGISITVSIILLILIRQIDIYEKEPWSLVVFSFIWGALGATIFSLFANEINQYIFSALFGERVGDILTSIISAPVFEEIFKLLIIPVIIIFFRVVFNSPLDGIVYIFCSSLGFKIVEDLLYGANFTIQGGAMQGFFFLVLARWILGFMSHPLMSVFSGFAVGLATITPNFFLKIVYIVVGYFLSVLAHFIWNFVASVGVMYFGNIACLWFPIQITVMFIIFIALYFFALNIEKNLLRQSLQDDISSGFLSYQILDELIDFRLRRIRKSSLGEYNRRLYDVFMTELASYTLLKRQSVSAIFSDIHDEIQRKRQIISYIKPYIYGNL